MKIDFGKYNGKEVQEIFLTDNEYFNWIINNKRLKKVELKEYCKKYLKEYMMKKEIDQDVYDNLDEFYNIFKNEYKQVKKQTLKNIEL